MMTEKAQLWENIRGVTLFLFFLHPSWKIATMLWSWAGMSLASPWSELEAKT